MYIIFNIKHIYFLIFSHNVALYLYFSHLVSTCRALSLSNLRFLFALTLFVIDFINLTIKKNEVNAFH